jgi:hypothetical protein
VNIVANWQLTFNQPASEILLLMCDRGWLLNLPAIRTALQFYLAITLSSATLMLTWTTVISGPSIQHTSKIWKKKKVNFMAYRDFLRLPLLFSWQRNNLFNSTWFSDADRIDKQSQTTSSRALPLCLVLDAPIWTMADTCEQKYNQKEGRGFNSPRPWRCRSRQTTYVSRR